MNVLAMFSGITRWLGINLSASGFGVPSVWMNIVLTPLPAPARPGTVRCGTRACGRRPAARVGSLIWLANRRVHCGAARTGASATGREAAASARDTNLGALEVDIVGCLERTVLVLRKEDEIRGTDTWCCQVDCRLGTFRRRKIVSYHSTPGISNARTMMQGRLPRWLWTIRTSPEEDKFMTRGAQ